jgi:hypothetical protein
MGEFNRERLLRVNLNPELLVEVNFRLAQVLKS